MLKIKKLKFNIFRYSSKTEKEVNTPPKQKIIKKNFFLFLDRDQNPRLKAISIAVGNCLILINDKIDHISIFLSTPVLDSSKLRTFHAKKKNSLT
jgi:hypothetical protein